MMPPPFGDQRDKGVEMAPERDAAPDRHLVAATLARRGALVPAVMLRGGADCVAVARVLEVLQPELHRICVGGRRHLVHEGFAAEQDRRTVGIAMVAGAQRR